MAKAFYLGVVERGLNGSFGVYFPDLPGCVSAGEDFETAVSDAQEALDLHLDGMREDGLEIPPPSPVTAFDPDEHVGSDVYRLVMFPAAVTTDHRDRVVRANVTFPETLLKRIDAAAQADGMTRASLLAIAARQYLHANAAASAEPEAGGFQKVVRSELRAPRPTRHG